MMIRFEEKCEHRKRSARMPMVQLPWPSFSRTMDGTNDSFSLNNSNPARFGRNLFNI